jgi:hypothetical protein
MKNSNIHLATLGMRTDDIIKTTSPLSPTGEQQRIENYCAFLNEQTKKQVCFKKPCLILEIENV